MPTIKRGNTEMEVKSLNFTVKQVGEPEDRTLQFIGSDETPDRDGDVISIDGWDLTNYKNNPVFLWAHDYSIPPVGKALHVRKNGKKLMFDIKFPEKGIYPFADLVYNLYKGGFLNATSVGFRGKKVTERNDEAAEDTPSWQRGVKFVEQELLELSAVPVPSNPGALQQAKSLGAVTDDEYSSLMSFINGDFVNSTQIGVKTIKGISHVYKAATEKDAQVQDNAPEQEQPESKSNEKEVNTLGKFSFVVETGTNKTLLMDTEKGLILGDVTEPIKELFKSLDNTKSIANTTEKAGASLSKQNKTRLSQAKDLIIEVLGENVEETDEEKAGGNAVLEDEEELTKPSDVAIEPQKGQTKSDEGDSDTSTKTAETEAAKTSEDNEDSNKEENDKTSTEDDDFEIVETDEKGIDISKESLEELIKSTVKSSLESVATEK